MKKVNFKTMLATLGLLTVAIPTSLSVVACGEVATTTSKLEDVIKTKIVAGEGTSADNLLTKLVEVNKEAKLIEKDFLIKDDTFKAASEGVDGSAVVIPAKDSKKYTGSVKITITMLAQIKLDAVVKNLEIAADTTEENALDRIITANKDANLTKEDLDISNFISSTPGVKGSVILIPNKDSKKYSAKANIVIAAKEAQKLEEVITNKSISGDGITAENVIDKILEANKNSKLVASDIEAKITKQPTKEADGSVEVTSKSPKFAGKVTITLTKLSA